MKRTIIGDLFVLLLFALVGLMSHQQGITLLGILTNSGPLIAAWLCLSPATKIYQRAPLTALLVHWLAAVTAGVFLRFLIVGRPFQLVFWLIALGFTGLLLVSWRIIDRQLAKSEVQ